MKIGQPDTDHGHSEKCIVGAVNSFTENDDLQSLGAIDKRIADVNSFIVVVLEMLKVGAIRKADF